MISHNLTERARLVLRNAESVAERFEHHRVSAMHVAIALIEEGTGVGATALRFNGVELGALAIELTAALDSATGAADIGADQLIADADREATSLEHRYVGTEHLLLTLLRDNTSAATAVLGKAGARYDDVKARIKWMLESDPQNPPAYEPVSGPR